MVFQGKNNCLFDVVGEQVGKTGDALRKETVVRMENNIENLANQANDTQRLKTYK